MSGFADVLESCSHCGFPIEINEATREYGFHKAHREARCLELLRAEIDRLRKELKAQTDRADFAWKNTMAIEKDRQRLDAELAVIRAKL